MIRLQGERTTVQKYSSQMIQTLMGNISSTCDLSHPGLKGNLRELFVANVIKHYMTSQFDLGKGAIINQMGDRSSEIDIIIYDTRIMPPFIKEAYLGLYAAESILATIEVRSWLKLDDILEAERNAEALLRTIYYPASTIYGDGNRFQPLCVVIGFFYDRNDRERVPGEMSEDESGRLWLNDNISKLMAICHVGRYSWMYVRDNWAPDRPHLGEEIVYEETKRFVAVLLDNIRYQAEERYRFYTQGYRDSIGIFIRDQIWP